MDMSDIDSMLVKLDLDTAQARAKLKDLQREYAKACEIVSALASAMGDAAAHAVSSIASAAKVVGDVFGKLAKKDLLDVVNNLMRAEKAAARFERSLLAAAGTGVTSFEKLLDKAKDALKVFLSPITDVMSLKSLFDGYMEDMEKLDSLSKKTALSMDERKKKQELLGRYTEKDLARYRESRQALDKFGDALRNAFKPVMEVALPALTWLAQKLEKLFSILSKHTVFTATLLGGLAGVLTAAVVPALIATHAAAVAAMLPFLPLIAIVAALALIIDDLWAYMNGCESALSGFWSIFGTGKEISAALGAAWESLKTIGTALWNGLKDAARFYFTYIGQAVQAFINVFKSAIGFVTSLFTGNFDEAFEHLKSLFLGMGDLLVAVLTIALGWVHSTFVDTFMGIGDFLSGVLDGVANMFTGCIKNIVAKIPKFLLPDALAEWAAEADKTIKESAAAAQDAPATGAIAAAAAVSPAVNHANLSNSANNRVDVGGITVYAQSSDAKGIARETSNEINRTVAAAVRGTC